jgi:4-hydroxy-2-oxoglutarate aldolase
MPEKPLDLAGIYPPVPTFFTDTGNLDLATLRRHIKWLTTPERLSIAGIVALGSNGEAAHLDEAERQQVIQTIREVTPAALPVLAGASAQSTRGTIALCEAVARAGADAALILPPSYFRGQMNREALVRHYLAVAAASPIPIVVYNMPNSTGGLDLDAETIIAVAEHTRVLGVKDSAGNVTKLAEVAASARRGFQVLAGSASFLLPSLLVGATGAVAALANIAPRQCRLVIDLFQQGHLQEARALQARLIPINTAVTSRYGVPGLKAALDLALGYGGLPRQPLLALPGSEREHIRRLLSALTIEVE